MRIVILLTVFLYVLTQTAYPQRKPNIIFILADDLGYKDLGCYGNPFNETLVLDQMAGEGMRFTQAYAHPACSPSRAALMTGKHPARLHITTALGVHRKDPESPVFPAQMADALPSKEVTLAEILKKNGYTTGMIGKWHLGNGDSTRPLDQGFDYERVIGKNALDYYNYTITSNNKTVFEDTGSVYLTDKLSAYGVEFISQQANDKPFFLYMAYSAPHLLIIPKSDKVSKYMWKYNQYDGKYNPYYATMIESMDEGIGKIFNTLKKNGLYDNTMIVFKSDNGGVGMDQIAYRPTIIDPLRAWKGHVYEGGIRVPLIIQWKNKIQTSTENHHYVTIHDFVPTIMELIGDHDLPDNLDGKSFLTTIFDPEQKYDRGPIYFHFPHFSGQGARPAGAVRDGKWKLVQNYETGETELFNLEQDIGEERDLSKIHPEKSNELFMKFKSWQKEIKANMPEKNPTSK